MSSRCLQLSDPILIQVVEKDDVCEAIRLMEMSKDSLKAAPVTSKGQQEVRHVGGSQLAKSSFARSTGFTSSS